MSSDDDDDDPKLPEDVTVEILKRLPVKYLLRCRCVCKSWRSTIDGPGFVAIHLSYSARDASNWYIVCLDWCRRLCSLLSDESLSLHSPSQIRIPFVIPPNCYSAIVSCDGLICVAERLANGFCPTMHLWNLFTRKHKVIRRSDSEHQPFRRETALGFCFDFRSTDYKVVRILFPFYRNRERKALVEIYSLDTDSWITMEREIPAISGYERAAFLNGNLHWFAFNFEDMKNGAYGSIVLFGLEGGVFDEMPLPEEIINKDKSVLVVSVEVLNDLLAVVISRGEPVEHGEWQSICSVWVMREYGMPQSWINLNGFEINGLVKGIDGFTWNGDLMMKMAGGQRVSWNPITGRITNLPSWTTYDLVTAVDSLV